MPRNGSSVYSLPAGNPVVSGTIIATTWANTTLSDIATALTNSLSTDGSTAAVSLSGKTMSGGTFSAPTVTGILTLTGGQIKFPAVAVPSADVNTLDDYEEGTWTPTMTFATPGNQNIAYSQRVGTYTKIGQLAYFKLGLTTSTFTHTTASGVFQITGWPFAPAANGNFGPTSGAMLFTGWNQNTSCGTIGYVTTGSIMIVISIAQGTPAVQSSMDTTNHTTGQASQIYTAISYEVP